MISRAAVLLLATITACDRGSDSPPDAPRAVFVKQPPSDSAKLAMWYASRSESISRLATSPDSAYMAVAVAEPAPNGTRRTRVDLWTRPIGTSPKARSFTADGGWIDAFAVELIAANTIRVFALAASEGTSSFGELSVRGDSLITNWVNAPEDGDLYQAVEFNVQRSNKLACAIRIRWVNEADAQKDLRAWYGTSPKGLFRANQSALCK